MTRRRVPLLVAAVVALLPWAPINAGAIERAGPSTPLTWQSAGDSYSSGEGVYGNAGACAQSSLAYGPVAAGRLRTAGWRIDNETFTACTGHLVEDYFNSRTATGESLWAWGREQSGPPRVDVITMSFGGNDVGFEGVLNDCVTLTPDSWADFMTALSGCDTSEAELETRIDRLLDPTTDCTGRRSTDAARNLKVSVDGFDCKLALDGRRGSIIDFFYDVVAQRLTRRGRLYVVGYPRIFADFDQWSTWRRISCETIKRGDTEKLGRLAEYLNNKLQDAVKRANQALGAQRVVFVDRFAIFRDGLHELCGTNTEWLNGISLNRDDGKERRKAGSFHPNKAGHAATAERLAQQIQETFPKDEPPDVVPPLAMPTVDTTTTSVTGGGPAPTPTVEEPCEAPDGTWSGTWESSVFVSDPGTVRAEITAVAGVLMGSISVTGSPYVSGGNISGTIDCRSVSFGKVDGSIEFSGTLSSDGSELDGTYRAWKGPKTAIPTDVGTFTVSRVEGD